MLYVLVVLFLSGPILALRARHPLQLDSLHGKYDLVRVHSEEKEDGSIALKFVTDNLEYDLTLHKSLGLLGRNYTHQLHSFHPTTRRRLSSTSVAEPENCFYRGTASIPVSPALIGSAAVHNCWGGFSGAVIIGSHIIGIEPASRHLEAYANDDETHIIYNLRDMHYSSSSGGNWSCGHSTHDTPTSFVSLAQKSGTASPLLGGGPSTNKKVVELVIVNDFARYTALQDDTETSSFAVVNYVNAIYSTSTVLDPQLEIVLVAQHSFTERDPYELSIGTCADCLSNEVGVNELLSNFESWLMTTSSLMGFGQYDNAQLFSGLDFEGGVLGYAPVGSMCSTAGGLSAGVEQMDPTSDTYSASVVAHEMGHNFGMLHDGQENSCPVSGFIMNSRVIKDPPPSVFSSCSGQYFSDSIKGFGCLDNEPSKRWSSGTVTCGNGIIESNATVTEECDCGKSGSGASCAGTSDPCCDATTCKLLASAQCSEKQGCCKQCKIQPRATECRGARGSCDVAEMCDGVNAQCPRDLVKGAGTPCVDEKTTFSGKCYGGTCASQSAQCKGIGTHFNNTLYNACSEANQIGFNRGNFCGILYCEKNQQCTSFRLSGAEERVADGVSCGDGEQCLNGNCVASSTLPSNTNWKTSQWLPETCDCGMQQTRTRTCVQNTVPSSEVSTMYCSVPAPAVSRPCFGCQTDQNVLLDIGSELTEKFKTKESMEFLRNLIPRFGREDFAPSDSAYQIGVALLAIPGALVVILCCISSCISCSPKQEQISERPRRTTYFYRRWPMFALMFMALVMFIYMILAIYYNASFRAAVYDESYGARANVLAVMDETTDLATRLEQPLISINETLPSVVQKLNALLTPLDVSIVDELKAAAEFYRNYEAPIPYTCVYCPSMQLAMIDALREFQDSPSWKDVTAMSYGAQSIQLGIVSTQMQIVSGINAVVKVTKQIKTQVSPSRSLVDGMVQSYSIYDTIRMIVVYAALGVVLVPVILIFAAHLAKKPTFYRRARTWSLELVFIYGLLLVFYLPASVVLNDTCHKLASLERNLSDVVTDPRTAVVVQTCLMDGSLLEALNRSSGVSDLMLLDFASSIQLPPKTQNLSFDQSMQKLQSLQTQIDQQTTQSVFNAQSTSLDIELVKLKQRAAQLTVSADRLVTSAQHLLDNFEQIRPIVAPLLDAGASFQDLANCKQIGESYQQFKVAWCESANTSTTFIAMVCVIMIVLACGVAWIAPKAKLRALIPNVEGADVGQVPLENSAPGQYMKLEDAEAPYVQLKD